MVKLIQKLFENMNNLKTKSKLLAIYFITGILPIMILGSVSIYSTNKNMLQFEKSQLSAENNRVRNIMFNLTYLTSNISHIISTDPDLLNILTTQFMSEGDVYTAYRGYSLLDTFKSNYTEISSITVYYSNLTLINNGRFKLITDDIKQSSWYKAAIQSSGEVIWTDNALMDGYNTIYMARKINIPQNSGHAVLLIGISNNYLGSMFEGNRFHSLIDLDNRKTVYSKNLTEINKPLPLKNISALPPNEVNHTMYKNQKILTYISSLNALYSNNVFHIVTISYNLSEVRQTILIFIFILFISVLLPLALIIRFSNSYSKRVNIVREEMHKVARGDLNITHSIIGTDELGELFCDMNYTIHSIQQLNEEIFQEKLSKKELENEQQKIRFELLASQINPHFLFNTLESIRMQAAIDGQEKLTEIIMELGKLLRFSLENKNELVTLSHELAYLKSYFEIQHFRFQDKINYDIHISPKLNITKIKVLPLILQPIVENAFTHGFSTKKIGGHIEVNILSRDNNLIIIIKDNGVGIAKDKLEAIMYSLTHETNNTSDAIGIRNVHNRICLFYGEQYGISFSSELSVGTTVTIKIPFREEFTDESIIY